MDISEVSRGNAPAWARSMHALLGYLSRDFLGALMWFYSNTSTPAWIYLALHGSSGLITDGMFRYIRHPDCLGEMLVYASFALMVWHWLPWLVLALVWTCVFAVNVTMKEASLSRHPGWADYRRRSGWLLPFIL